MPLKVSSFFQLLVNQDQKFSGIIITLIQVNQESVSIINFIAKLCMREYLTKDLNLYIL